MQTEFLRESPRSRKKELRSTALHVLALRDLHGQHDELPVAYLVDHAVSPAANPVPFLRGELLAARGPGVTAKRGNALEHAPQIGRRDYRAAIRPASRLQHPRDRTRIRRRRATPPQRQAGVARRHAPPQAP